MTELIEVVVKLSLTLSMKKFHFLHFHAPGLRVWNIQSGGIKSPESRNYFRTIGPELCQVYEQLTILDSSRKGEWTVKVSSIKLFKIFRFSK